MHCRGQMAEYTAAWMVGGSSGKAFPTIKRSGFHSRVSCKIDTEPIRKDTIDRARDAENKYKRNTEPPKNRYDRYAKNYDRYME